MRLAAEAEVQIALHHPHERPRGLARVERQDPAGRDLVLDVPRGGVDEPLHDLGVGLLDAGVVGGRVGQRAHHMAVLGVHTDDAAERLARHVAAVAVAAHPSVRHLEQLGAEMLDHPQHEVVPVAEVDVERGPREVRPPHHLVDRELPERPLAQERLGGGDDLALRDFRGPPPAPPWGDIPRVHVASLVAPAPANYHAGALVAQRLERRTFNPRDPGSIPGEGTTWRN